MVFGTLGKLFGNVYVKLAIAALLVSAVIGYGEWRYAHGYAAAENKYIKINNEALNAQLEEHKLEVDRYTKRLTEADTKKREAESAAKKAEQEAAKQKQRANRFERQYEELLDEVPLSHNDSNNPFTVGFVGMYNLATQGSTSTDTDERKIDLSDVASAAGFTGGSAGVVLTESANLSVKDVLGVIRKNAAIANQCKDERKVFQQFIKDVCDAGYCTGIEPIKTTAIGDDDEGIEDIGSGTLVVGQTHDFNYHRIDIQ